MMVSYVICLKKGAQVIGIDASKVMTKISRKKILNL